MTVLIVRRWVAGGDPEGQRSFLGDGNAAGMISGMVTHADDGPQWWLRLWGLDNRRLDLALTLVTVAVLVASRFALLASGPWEWDETIFARGMLDFSLAAHFPQPPGFPGLLALGHLFLPVAGAPYQALQLVSALASVFMLWPLAILGRRVAPPAVATAAALLVLFLPGPWLFSVRGFSTMAAAALAMAAAALVAGGLEGRRTTIFTLLLTASFLVRPILLPTMALLWLMGAEAVRPRRRLLPGLFLGTASVVIAILVMARLEGGWAAFVEPFVTHATFHADRLHRNTQVLADLGLIKGVGGLASSFVLGAVSALGLGVWWRKVGTRAVIAWIAVLGLTIAQLVMLQNRSYARYSVGVQMATAPLIAGAASLASPPVAVAGLLGMTGIAAWSSMPLLQEQHTQTFGAWQATVDAAERAADRNWAVVVEPEIHVFSSYWWSVLEHRGDVVPPVLLSPRAPEPWQGIHRPWLVATVHPHLYWPSLTGSQTTYGGVSEGLRPLTQDRFLAAAVIDNPPLPVGRWWAVEHFDDGRPFMWAGPGAELVLPPVPVGTLIGLELRPALGETPLVVTISHGGGRYEIDGVAAPTRLWVWTTDDGGGEPVLVRLQRDDVYPPGRGDDRPLVAQLSDVVVRPPGAGWRGGAATEAERASLRFEFEGVFDAEAFSELGRGVWLAPKASFRLTVDEPGTVRVRVAAPRPTPARPVVMAAGEIVAGPFEIDHRPITMDVTVGDDDVERGFIDFEIVSEAYSPAASGGADTRELGVVLLGLEFEPERPSVGWWNTPD